MIKNIAIIGSNSFSGKHLIRMCREQKYTTYGISRYENDECDYHLKADLNKDMPKIKRFLHTKESDAVINIASLAVVQTSWDHPGDYFRTNCASMSDMVNGLLTNKFIQISTPEVYGNASGKESTVYNPSTPYAMAKAMFDVYLMSLYKHFNFPVSFIRPCNWFGPEQQIFKIIPKTIIKIKKGETLYLEGNGQSKRNFIYIDDVCDAILKIMNHGKNGEIYHATSDEYVSIRKLVEMICDRMDYDFNELVEISEERIGKDMDYLLDSSKIKKELNWKPKYNLIQGIDKTIKWIDQEWDILKYMSLEYTFRS